MVNCPHHPASPYTEHWEYRFSPQEAGGVVPPSTVEVRQVGSQAVLSEPRGDSGGDVAGTKSRIEEAIAEARAFAVEKGLVKHFFLPVLAGLVATFAWTAPLPAILLFLLFALGLVLWFLVKKEASRWLKRVRLWLYALHQFLRVLIITVVCLFHPEAHAPLGGQPVDLVSRPWCQSNQSASISAGEGCCFAPPVVEGAIPSASNMRNKEGVEQHIGATGRRPTNSTPPPEGERMRHLLPAPVKADAERSGQERHGAPRAPPSRCSCPQSAFRAAVQWAKIGVEKSPQTFEIVGFLLLS